jgi:putative sigma-54 modulation protein
MKLEFSGKNLSLTDALRTKAETKISKLQRFTGPIVSAHASFVVEKRMHQVDLVVHCSHDRIYKARGMADDMYMAVNDAATAIEQQAKKEKTKRLAGRSKGAPAAEAPAEEEAEEEKPRGSRRPLSPAFRRRADLFHPRPLTLQDALFLLDKDDAPLLCFYRVETGQAAVLFRDRDGVSLVEPPVKA